LFRLLTGAIILSLCGLCPTVWLSAATTVPIPVAKPFVIKTTPFSPPSKPESFSHKMIIVFPQPRPEVAHTKDTSQDLKITDEMAITENNIPVPGKKPQSFDAKNYVSITEMASTKTRDKKVDQKKTRSRRPASPVSSTEKIPATQISKLRETNAASPFKSRKAQKIGKLSANDPVVLFFQENSSELEVGQIDILKEDVIETLKHQPDRQATVYGLVAQNRTGSESARQLAVSRATMVREYIVDRHINGDRIDVQTLINDDQLMPKDRVDIVIH